jgi:hypothetical protein
MNPPQYELVKKYFVPLNSKELQFITIGRDEVFECYLQGVLKKKGYEITETLLNEFDANIDPLGNFIVNPYQGNNKLTASDLLEFKNQITLFQQLLKDPTCSRGYIYTQCVKLIEKVDSKLQE